MKIGIVHVNPFASTSQPPKKVSLNDEKAGLLAYASPFYQSSHESIHSDFFGSRQHLQLRGQLRFFGFPFKPRMVPLHR